MFPCPVGLDQISKKRPEPQEMAGSRHPPEPPPDAGFYAREFILATWAFLVPNPARSPRSRLLDNIGNSDSPIRLCSGLLVQWAIYRQGLFMATAYRCRFRNGYLPRRRTDRKSTRLNSSHLGIS